MFEQTFKNIDDVLWKEAGCTTELDYTEQTSWLLFLKYLDDLEHEKALEAQLVGKSYTFILDEVHRWSSWAAPKKADGTVDHDNALIGDDLIDYVNRELFPYLQGFKLRATSPDTIEYKIGEIFSEIKNRFQSGYSLRDALEYIDELRFRSQQEKHELSHLYEAKIRNMGNAGRNGGEYYTPRPLIRAMIRVVKPEIGDRIYDGACGSAGFLCESYDYLRQGKLTTKQLEQLQTSTFTGKEKKSLAYVIAIMNMILHGIDAPNIIHTNTLTENLSDIQDKNRFDVILANPPFGGKERKEIQQNFPIKTGETAFLFLQHFIKMLKVGGRAAVVIKNTFLSNSDNASRALRQELLSSCNLHTILDCPGGTFLGAGVKTVVLFFEKGTPTQKIWYYQLDPGRNMGKTNALNDEDLHEFVELQATFAETKKSWLVDIANVERESFDLLVKRSAEEEQAALLRRGSDVWNSWRKKYFDTQITLSHTDLSNADLRGADLRGADLRNAYLVGTNFCNADLQQADLSYAKLGGARLRNADLMDARLRKAKLRKADLQGAYLVNADLYSADLRNANLSFATLSIANLCKANLSSANLSHAKCLSADLRKAKLCTADLNNANLCEANLRSANLRSANLFEAQVLRTNFKYANLNGACIQDWQIGSSTTLEEVSCDYIFRTYDDKEKKFSGRLPVDPESAFSHGEFTQRFQIIASALETIDITFTEGIDWQAFFQSFQELKQRYPDKNIAVQGMEEKGDAFVVRLKVEVEETGPELERLKADIETAEKRFYSVQLVLREAQGELRVYREMMGVVKTMADKTVGDQNFYAPVGNVAQTNQGNMQNIQHIYAPDQQDLSEAAKEIQALLNTLAETYNTTTDAGKENLMKDLGQKVKQHPKWRRALKAGGIELIKVLCAPIGVPLEMARIYLEDE